ncbi:hypothetical protein DE146DRAFT_667605 [Phaeosphaeria sp. MPI-PUGE-AT-0046c]|nr:hypothetical protein DE146DRAFT_667605 [Phaeosphaeria sp. MPI-PUGE-AT-0046c]
MLFTKLTAFFALAASIQAWVIPEGAANGVYAVTRDADGKDVHTRIDQAESALEERDADYKLERRFYGQIFCGCGFTLNRGNTDSAVAKLKAQLGGGAGAVIPAHQSFYSITNDVVAFVCSRNDGNGRLPASVLTPELAAITSQCGLYIAGAREIGSRDGAAIVGYQRYKNGDNFCATSTSSSADHC